jgi:CRP-like cAMP-binding protein
MAGPTIRTYKAGSIIYFIGDRGNDIFVLQKGRIILISNSLDTSSEVKEDVQRGEFFGVKSATGMYPREETAQVISDSVVLVFTPQVFESFCLKNPRIVLQMLKVFSGQLRKVHRKVREVLGESKDRENSYELLGTAEYYYKQKQKDHAKYAYRAFMKHYKDSKLGSRAQRMMTLLESGQPYPPGQPTIEEELARMEDMPGNYSPSIIEGSDLSKHLPQDDIEIPDLDDMDEITIPEESDDFSLPEPGINDASSNQASSSSAIGSDTEKDVTSLYYEGLNEFSQENFPGAISKYEAILKSTRFNNEKEASFLEKALYELGRTHQRVGANNPAMERFTEFVKKYPRSDLVKKALIGLAECHEKKGDKQRAASLYSKVISLPPKDKDTILARKKLERIKN